jgi:DNA polymerase elongation subunit (family B)
MRNKMDIDPITEELLKEAKRTSRAVVTRQTKIKKATGQLASVEARTRNDPLYKRMVKYRELYYKYRAMIHKKYSPRVRSKARR